MKRILLATAIIAALLALAAGFAAWGTHAARRLIEEHRHDIAGLSLEIGGYELDWHLSELLLRDIRIYPAGREDDASMLASAEELVVHVVPRSLLFGVLRAHKVEFVRPRIVYAAGPESSNWDALTLGRRDGAAVAGALPFVVDDVIIEDGEIVVRDPARGRTIDLAHVNGELLEIRPARTPGELPTAFELSAELGATGGRIRLEGAADLFGEGLSFDLAGSLSAAPIRALAALFGGRAHAAAGSIALTSRARVRNNLLASTHHATFVGLRVGGGASAAVNNFVLSQAGPIGIDVAVDGDLGDERFSFFAALSASLARELARTADDKAQRQAAQRLEATVARPFRKASLAPVRKGIRNLFKHF